MKAKTNTAVAEFGFSNLPSIVRKPGYNQSEVTRGIIHFGPGGFALAHAGHIVHDYMAATGDLTWGICAVSLRSDGTVNALRDNGNQYVLVEREGEEKRASLLTPIVQTMFAPADPMQVVAAIADNSSRMVTACITGPGYYMKNGKLEASASDIVHDLDLTEGTSEDAPRTIYWYLTQGLLARMAAGGEPLTIVSLDNLPENSKSFRTALLAFIADCVQDSATLVAWIEQNVDFLTTLVDRITPEVTKQFREDMAEWLGFDAKVVVGTEVFRQLVIEQGRFPVPAWGVVGVETVEDIAPYWELKFLGLNAGHQVPAMVGQRFGATYIHEAMGIEEVEGLLELFHSDLGVILGHELMSSYGPKIRHRFLDSAPMDTIRRVGARGTSKASQRILYAIERGLAVTEGKQLLLAPTYVFAVWLLNLGNTDELGNHFQQDDADLAGLQSIQPEVLAWARADAEDKHGLAHILRRIGESTKDNRFVEMAGKDVFVTALSKAVRECHKDTREAIRALLQS